MDLPDLIRLICGFRDEAYPYERTIALVTFCTWIHFPRDSRVVDGASATAAATILAPATKFFTPPFKLPGKEARAIAAATFQQAQAASLIVSPPVEGGYKGEIESKADKADDLSSIALFFVRCPKELKPSLNKAVFFIENRGFAEEDDRGWIPSDTTLREAWTAGAETAAFFAAADYVEKKWLYGLSPDNPASLKLAHKFHTNDAREFFSTAARIQETMIGFLHDASKARFKFMKLPKEIPLLSADFFPLEDDQISIVKRYKAPSQYGDN